MPCIYSFAAEYLRQVSASSFHVLSYTRPSCSVMFAIPDRLQSSQKSSCAQQLYLWKSLCGFFPGSMYSLTISSSLKLSCAPVISSLSPSSIVSSVIIFSISTSLITAPSSLYRCPIYTYFVMPYTPLVLP